MEPGRYDKLKRLMASIGRGDRLAAFTLRVEFAPELRAAVRRAARSVGRTLPADEVEAVATDFSTWLIPHAGAWRPDGALPWQWAFAHLTNEVRRNQGFWPLTAVDPRADERGDDRALQVAAPSDGDVLETFGRVVRIDPRAASVRRVLEATSGPADIAMLLQYAAQAEAGDPSPSHTIADEAGLTPAAVRKRVQRARQRARSHIATHPELAPLADLPLFDTGRRQRAA